MTRLVRFRIRGRLDSAGPEVDGELTVERVADPGIGGIVRVRRLRARKAEYVATLVGLADLIISRQIEREAREKRAAAGEKRRARRGRR